MNAATISAIATAAVSIIGAAAAFIKTLKTQKAVAAHITADHPGSASAPPIIGGPG